MEGNQFLPHRAGESPAAHAAAIPAFSMGVQALPGPPTSPARSSSGSLPLIAAPTRSRPEKAKPASVGVGIDASQMPIDFFDVLELLLRARQYFPQLFFNIDVPVTGLGPHPLRSPYTPYLARECRDVPERFVSGETEHAFIPERCGVDAPQFAPYFSRYSGAKRV
jgi:hypothetical protein